MIKALIVDDEQLGRTFLQMVIQKLFSDITLVGLASSASEAKELIELKMPDLVFLDVEMPVNSGFDLLESLEKINFQIIFTTAHDSYALKAIKFSAIDYLLKPIDLDELETAVNKARKAIKSIEGNSEIQMENLIQNLKNLNKSLHKLGIPTREGILFIPLQEIVHLEADGSYTNFFLISGKKIVSGKPLKEFADMLAESNFFRIHKSHLINLAHIVKYIRGDGGMIEMVNGRELEVSRRSKETFLHTLEKLI
jgi:two-component system LytT family response regulator